VAKTPTDNHQQIEERNFRFEKYKYKVEIIKWLIGSIAITVATLIIDNGFKERDAGIQEMQAFDKYVEVILKADDIESRWLLSQYFATVTPTERLRQRWIAYQDSIEDDYRTYKALTQEKIALEQQLDTISSPTVLSKHDLRMEEIKMQLAPLNKKLIGSTHDSLSAKSWEDKGFQFILSKDVSNAIIAFQNSENASNGYNQVYEIARYLKKNKMELNDANSKHWGMIAKELATNYSYGMGVEVKKKLEGM